MFGINDNGNNGTAAADAPGQMMANPIGMPASPAPTMSDGPSEPPAPTPLSGPPAPSAPSLDSTPAPSSPAPAVQEQEAPGGELLQLKQQALQNLAPLIDHLDQTPEEKFKTTMMLIQASDNAQLVKEAYEAANQITDEKARAQALLDVVNEINYFTHPSADGEGGQAAKA